MNKIKTPRGDGNCLNSASLVNLPIDLNEKQKPRKGTVTHKLFESEIDQGKILYIKKEKPQKGTVTLLGVLGPKRLPKL